MQFGGSRVNKISIERPITEDNYTLMALHQTDELLATLNLLFAGLCNNPLAKRVHCVRGGLR